MKINNFFYLLLILLIPFLFIGCLETSDDEEDDDGNELAITNSYAGTQAPGDFWEWDIDWDNDTSGTFSATNYGTSAGLTAAKTYSGTTSKLPSKFIKFVITETNDADVTVGTDSAICYGVEIPGTAVLVQPAGSVNNLITCSVQGSAPAVGAKYNWTRIPDAETMDDHDSLDIMAYGISTVTAVNGTTFTFHDEK